MSNKESLELLDMIRRDTPEDEIESLRAQLTEVTAKNVMEEQKVNLLGRALLLIFSSVPPYRDEGGVTIPEHVTDAAVSALRFSGFQLPGDKP